MRFEDLLGSRYFFNGENSSDLDISVLQESDTGDACNSFTPEVAEKWAFTFSRYWISFKPKDRKIPNSGWKIHVSLQLEELHHDLPVLVNLLLAKGIPFKHVRGTKMYRLLLDKNSDRRQCGKAVTIYPNVDEIPSLIDTLKEVNFSPGPTVITDLPTYVNGISLRYGLFKPEKNTNTDSKVSRFEDNRRALDPATYDIESCPNEIREVLDISPRKSLPIRNAKALKQCGAGGVYSAQYKEGRVIIKQGRRFTGYDDTCSDGAHRVEREFKILRRLSTHNLDISPKVLNYVSSENETFLFLENIEGMSLHEWKRENYPLYAVNRIDYEQYLVSVKHIVSKLVDAIEKLHQVLLSHNDIHTRNIMWDAPQSGLRLIDFESCQHAQDLDDTYSPKAAGYYRNGLTDGFESDWYGASQVLQELIFSNVTHLDMDKSGVHKGWTRGYIGIKNSSPNLWEELKETFTELRKRSGQIVDFQIVNNTSNQSPQSTKGAISLLKSHNLTDSIYPHQIETESNSLLFGPHSNWRQLPQSGATTLTGKNWSSRNLLQVAIEPGGLIASGYLDSLLAEYFLHPGKNGVANRQTWSSKVLRIVESVLADRDLISASANTEAVKMQASPSIPGSSTAIFHTHFQLAG